MKQPVIGINLPDTTTLTNLDAELNRIQEDGYDACEINLSTFPLMIGGELQAPTVEFVKKVLSRHSLHYTAHASYGLDLRNLEERDMHRAVLFASIDICSALGMNPLNLHYEVQSMFASRELAFFRAVTEAADYAQARGIGITIENIEIEDAGKVADFLRTANHPNLGMTLDLGHLFLSANYYGYDYLSTVEACAPLIRHLHINDNTGHFEPLRLTNFEIYNTLNRGYRFTFGRGDIHVPPFWGKAPLQEALSIIKKSGYKGIWLCEYYNQSFLPFNKGVQERGRREIETA